MSPPSAVAAAPFSVSQISSASQSIRPLGLHAGHPARCAAVIVAELMPSRAAAAVLFAAMPCLVGFRFALMLSGWLRSHAVGSV
jgi:hypothetical protein